MDFKNHIAQGIQFSRAKNIGGKIKPTVLVLHDTAGRLEKYNSANYLLDAPRGVSVHFVLERDGTLTQQVPTNRRAGHAGESEYHNVPDVNNFSIGIEIVNPGRMTAVGNGLARTWFKQTFNMAEHEIHEIETPEHGRGAWMDYTPEQLDTLETFLPSLFDYVPTLEDIVPHWYISPGRKFDTNPLFPLESIKARVLGRDDLQEQRAREASDDCEDAGELVQIDVPNSALNMRKWPSFNPNVIATIGDGVVVPVLRKGVFAGRKWLCVRFNGLEGWIVSNHAAPFITKT